MTKFCSVPKEIVKNGKKITICDETRSKLLWVLEEIQDKNGYISDAAMQEVADKFGIHPVEVYSVVTFYSFLTAKEQAKHVIRISTCLPCELAGSKEVVSEFEKQLKIKAGQATADKKITLELTSCIGACDQAPAIMVDDKIVGNVTPDKVKQIIEGLK